MNGGQRVGTVIMYLSDDYTGKTVKQAAFSSLCVHNVAHSPFRASSVA
jgi:hypothetical protein